MVKKLKNQQNLQENENKLQEALKNLKSFDVLGNNDSQETYDVTDYIGTGSYNLNRIVGGSLFKGIPAKRITALIGEEATGKTLFALTIAREAQKKGYIVAYFDSENALTTEFAKNSGIEVKTLIYNQVLAIEDFRHRVLELIAWKEEHLGCDQPMLIILDSYGGLTARKFITDIEDGKDTMDMGIFAKIAKATFKLIGSLMAKHNVTLVYTNHITTDSSGYVPVQVQTGGMAARYYPSTVVFLKKKIVKDADKIATGVLLTSQTTKSRIVPPFQTAEIYLDWEKGLDPYAGLFDIAVDLGLIQEPSKGWFSINGVDKIRKSELERTLFSGDDTVFINKLDELIRAKGYKTIEPVVGYRVEDEVKEILKPQGPSNIIIKEGEEPKGY